MLGIGSEAFGGQTPDWFVQIEGHHYAGLREELVDELQTGGRMRQQFRIDRRTDDQSALSVGFDELGCDGRGQGLTGPKSGKNIGIESRPHLRTRSALVFVASVSLRRSCCQELISFLPPG